MTNTRPHSYSVALAGSSIHTVACAQALSADDRFNFSWVLTPQPKKIGRDQKLTKNPVHLWAQSQELPQILVEKKIDNQIKDQLEQQVQQNSAPDFLLVVDFGYLVPDWLLELPQTAPVNIHPSLLPRWRGSSPGQMVLLNGDKQSAVSLIKMGSELDKGPLISQIEFKVEPDWNQSDYYQHSFETIASRLADILDKYAQEKIQEQPQPDQPPTPIARKLSKEDAFLPWKILAKLISGFTVESTQDDDQTKLAAFTNNSIDNAAAAIDSIANNSIVDNSVAVNSIVDNSIAADSILTRHLKQTNTKKWPQLIERAVRAFNPWPLVWTFIPTAKGKKRMQILEVAVNKTSKTGEETNKLPRLKLKKVRIEGQKEAKWAEVKNAVK